MRTLLLLLAATAAAQQVQLSHTTESLRGVSAVSREIAWASGTQGTYLRTTDAGKTWMRIDKLLPYRSGVAWAKDRWIAVGTSGSHFSLDNGATWKLLDRANYNSVGFTSTGEGWAAGPKGRIAKFAKPEK